MLEADRLVADAVDETGLDDFGAATWRVGLDELVGSVNDEADLTPLGEIILGNQIERSLANRLRVVDWHRHHPELVRPVRRPVVILGLPRTGTTLLSYLLDADPANRSLLRWEAFASVPPPDPTTMATDPRLAAAQAEMDALYAAAPEFKAIHYEAADGPTECVVVLGQDFRSVHYETMANLPSYGAWHEATDMVPAYRIHQLVLQTLQASWPGRWVLKSPCHNLSLDALDTVYPDAVFVATHRDPVTAVASLADLVSVLSGLSSDADADAYIGRRWLDLAATMIERFLAARDRLGEHRFFDLPYTELVAAPVDTMARLYDWLDWELPSSTIDRFRAYLDHNPAGRFGHHAYDLDQFALDADEIRARFAGYCERFDL